MIYVETIEGYVAENALETEVGKITCPEGYKIKILELGITCLPTTWIYCYIGDVRIVKYKGLYKITDIQRIVMDLEVVVGQEFKIVASTTTDDNPVILVVYDKSK